MVWFLLAVLFAGWHVLIGIGKLWGTEGIFLALMLGFGVLVIVVFGGLATLAWLLVAVMVWQCLQLAWAIYERLR